ncbi:MAG: hypothetical protein K0U45_01640 [Alphaproteobacteria bacterium]|nr:hypothetical protein [Alphaproteobacteria bacterium]
MAKYQFIDGFTFEANTDIEIIEKIRESAFVKEDSLKAYASALAQRCKNMSGAEITSWPPEKMVADMIEKSVLTPL